MLVETVSANPREPHRFEPIDQDRFVSWFLEHPLHESPLIPLTLFLVSLLGAIDLLLHRWNEPWRPFERRREQVQAAEHASDGFRTPQGSALLRDRVGSLHRGSDDSVWDGAIRASLRSSGDERMLGAVAKKRAVGSRKRIGSSHGVCPPHTLDRAAALDARRDLIEVHAKIRICMTQTGVPFDLLLSFTLNAHIPVIGFAPQKVARTTRRHPRRFLTQSDAS